MRAASTVDRLLRHEGHFAAGAGRVPWRELVWITSLAGAAYGAIMGTYGLRGTQMLYSALKVPMLLGVTTLICMPSFYVVNTLLGLHREFAAALRGVLVAQACLAVSLAGLAPLTIVFYISIDEYAPAPLFHGLLFLIATIAGQTALGRHYRPLVAANPRHRWGRRAWVLVYVFVAIQLAWLLRPFIGNPASPTQFFREDAWTNAYVNVASRLWSLLSAP